jgi:hypothetical protein
MSQHRIRATQPDQIVIVGYDPRLRNFFGQVHGAPGPIAWIAGVATVGELAREIQPYATMAEDVTRRLEDEAAHGGCNAAFDHT